MSTMTASAVRHSLPHPSTDLRHDDPVDAPGLGTSPPLTGGCPPPLRMPYMVMGHRSSAAQLAKVLAVLEAQWSQELHDARRAGRSVGYFQQRKQDLRRAIDFELDHGNKGETPLSAAYGRLLTVINTLLHGMPHVLNKVEGKRLRQLCQQYGERPETLLKRPDIRALLAQSTEDASRARPARTRRLKGPTQRVAPRRERSVQMDRWLAG